MFFSSHLTEDFLHFVWRTRNYRYRNLTSCLGKPVNILFPGHWNHNQGPDFLQAKVNIDGILWYGHVEIHLTSKDWYQHGHHLDGFYNNTILHVVHTSDGRVIHREDGSIIPELELKNRIPPQIIEKYKCFHFAQQDIPCTQFAPHVPAIHIHPWLERLGIERIQRKIARFNKRLTSTIRDWDQLIWEELAAILGGPVNQEAFRSLAQLLPYSLLNLYKDQRIALEALLFGAAGILSHHNSKYQDTYYQSLRNEWIFLKQKHNIHKASLIPLKFMRMRPASFPTIRLSQLAALLQELPKLIDLLQLNQLDSFFKIPVCASTYWNNHYRFFEPTQKGYSKKLGKKYKEIIVSNTIVPLSVIYHRFHGKENLSEIIELGLTSISPEHNRITKVFEGYGWRNEHALQSQGMIELKKYYCNQQKCLHCAVGNHILGKHFIFPKPDIVE